MKKFIIKTNLFALPMTLFVILFFLNTLLYNQQEGDLARIGYLYSNPTPKSLINNQYNLPKSYTLLSEVDVATKRKFDVITIGDSFSEQGTLGYKNFLGYKDISVLHVDNLISGSNPIQTLVQLFTTNFFDHIRADYIVLQSVEREFNLRTKGIDFDLPIQLDAILDRMNDQQEDKNNYKLKFFSEATLKIPLTNLQYFFEPKPSYSQTYKFKSNRSDLFTNEPNELLFYQNDINYLDTKNDSLNILESIKVVEKINDLVARHDIKLIVLVSPDKYDLYYQFIADKSNLIKPLFFEIYEQAKKKYINIDSYRILSKKLNFQKDIYFYDDTHWTPKAAKIMADTIYNIISK